MTEEGLAGLGLDAAAAAAVAAAWPAKFPLQAAAGRRPALVDTIDLLVPQGQWRALSAVLPFYTSRGRVSQ
jgi:hypothetical protein